MFPLSLKNPLEVEAHPLHVYTLSAECYRVNKRDHCSRSGMDVYTSIISYLLVIARVESFANRMCRNRKPEVKRNASKALRD